MLSPNSACLFLYMNGIVHAHEGFTNGIIHAQRGLPPNIFPEERSDEGKYEGTVNPDWAWIIALIPHQPHIGIHSFLALSARPGHSEPG